MPYTANGAWEQLIEGSRKVDFSLAIVRTSNTNIPQDKIESVSLESTATSNNSINFGTTCSDSVKITLRDYDSTLLFEGAKLRLAASVQNDDGTSSQEYQVGMFYVDSVKKTETYGDGLNLEITAYDGFYKTEQIYSPSASLGANPTIRAVVTDILQKCGLTDRFGDAFIDETEWSNTITLDSIKADLTCRQQIGYLAALQGCFAKFNDEGNLTARWYTDTAKVITRDEQFMAEMTQDMKSDLTVSMIETGTSDNVIVKPSSALGYSIKFENPYITDSIADNIYTNKVSGGKIKFRPLSVRWRGNPQIVVGDIVKVEDKTGNYLTCYVMQKTLSFDGGMSETYKCYGESTSSVAFNKSPSDVKFERIYSRMEEAVKAATSAVKQTEGSTFELIPKTKDSTENIGFRLYYKDSQDNAFDKCVIMATAGGIGFSTNGGESYDAAAIYFAKDSSGVIHGYINGEFIQAGTISSDKINTSQLIISKGNVEGLESDLTTINNNVTVANSNASAAVITANEAKGTADSVSGTISDWIYTDHGVTYIDGGKIYTGSIAANSIDVSKLKAGTVKLGGEWDNNDYSSSSTDNAAGWEGVYTTFSRSTNYLTATYSAAAKNLISSTVSDFDMSYLYGWKISGATYTLHDTGSQHYITLTFSNSGTAAFIYTDGSYKVNLEKGKKYSIAAKFNGGYWSSITGFSGAYAGYVIDGSGKFNPTTQNISPNDTKNEERIIEWTFDFNGETGSHGVGIYLYGAANSFINLDWIAVYEADNRMDKGFRCSYSGWLKDGYKKTNLLVYQDTPDAYITTRQGENGDVQRMTRRHTLKKGKRYALVARLDPNAYELGSNMAITACVNKENLSFVQQATDPQIEIRYGAATFKFVFDYTGEDGLCDVGLAWKGLLPQTGTGSNRHSDVYVYWLQLYQDDVDELGFYCSNVGWLKSGYQTAETNLISDVPSYSDYVVIRSALQVYNNALYFRGKVTSPYGNVGALDYSPNLVSVSCDTAYYETTGTITANTLRTAYSSTMLFEKSPQTISLDEVESVLPVDLQSQLSVTQKFDLISDDGDHLTTIVNAGGIKATSGAASSYTKLSYDGIETSGSIVASSITVGSLRADRFLGTFSPSSISTSTVSATNVSAEAMSTSSDYASGFVHTRTNWDYSSEGDTVKLIAGRETQWTGYNKNVVAIELSSGGTVYARMNVSDSWGSACGVITLKGAKNGMSAPLELGKTEAWFNGNSLTSSSSEKYKTDILPYTDSALALVNSSVIYSFKYKSGGENALIKYGLIIERECPQEVVDNSGDAISLYSMCSILWKSVQELSAKVKTLENSKLR